MKFKIENFFVTRISSKLLPVSVVVSGPLGSQVIHFRITETVAGFIVTDAPNTPTQKALFEKPFNTLHDASEAIKLLVTDEIKSVDPITDRSGVTRKPSPEEYQEARCRNALSFAPSQKPCQHCGWPVLKGYCCDTCGSNQP
jgi:hypothetical protein